MMWEPIVKENKLYGLSLNPLGKYAPKSRSYVAGHFGLCKEAWLSDLREWELAESKRRLVEVNEAEYNSAGMYGYVAWINSFEDFILSNDTFTADESNGKLINLKII